MDAETQAERAAEILNSEIFRNAELRARQRLMTQWASEPSAPAREAIWHKLQAIDAMRRELEAIRGDGVKARFDRERANKGMEHRA